jgi:hypothetical protein
MSLSQGRVRQLFSGTDAVWRLTMRIAEFCLDKKRWKKISPCA